MGAKVTSFEQICYHGRVPEELLRELDYRKNGRGDWEYSPRTNLPDPEQRSRIATGLVGVLKSALPVFLFRQPKK